MTALLIVAGYLGVSVLVACWQVARQGDIGEAARRERCRLAAERIERGAYRLTNAQAEHLMGDLFPRPMGAPSIVEDVQRLREWREHRALRGVDHRWLHAVEDLPNEQAFDAIAADQILSFCVGGYEIEGGE